MASQETEASSVSNFRAYLRINTVQPNPDYSKSGIIDHPIAGLIVSLRHEMLQDIKPQLKSCYKVTPSIYT